jgi:subtilisin family serine protease
MSTARAIRLGILSVLVLATISVPGVSTASAQVDQSTDREPTEILVRRPPGLSPQSADTRDWVVVLPDVGETLSEALVRLGRIHGADNVAYNLPYRLHGAPNDPLFGSQWNFDVVGVVAAWDETEGAGVTVAVVDTGVALGGEDLACHTFVDPYNAFTFTTGLDAVVDIDGHGTHITGTLAQCTNNLKGVAGIAQDVSIMPVKVTDDETQVATSLTLATGIDWAVAHGADVVNISMGRDCAAVWPICSDPVVTIALDGAEAAGVVVVVSSGNSNDPFVASPANHPFTIAVGASTISNSRAGYSSYGSALSLVAPGGSAGSGILQETFNGGPFAYYFYIGTSSAAPHVSGAAALVLAVQPSLTPAQVRSLLGNTALDLGPVGWDQEHGSGLLQIDAAVTAALNPDDPCPGPSCDTIYTIDSGSRWTLWDELNVFSATSSFYFGNPGDIGFSGDWNCNEVATPGLYRQSDGFVYLRNSNTQGIADITFFFGNPGDVPVAGDFNNDGCDTVSLYRPSEGRFFVINELGKDGGGLGAAETSYFFGNPGDKPFAGDFDGDGIDTFGLHRESTGLVYFRNSHTQGIADSQFIYGDPGDVLFAGDWDGDGDDTVAVYRPGNGVLYVKLTNTAGNADHDVVIGFFPKLIRSVGGQRRMCLG